jgi:hypothetical protein
LLDHGNQAEGMAGEIHAGLKPPSGDRVIDLHSSMAELLREYIGSRSVVLLEEGQASLAVEHPSPSSPPGSCKAGMERRGTGDHESR